MADSDPNRPRDYGERLNQHIHDEINARLDARMARRRAKMERRMERWEHRRHSPVGGVLLGTVLAGVGVLLLLQNLGFSFVDEIWDWWPAILIAFGAARLMSSCGWGGKVWGAMLMFGGGVLLAHNLGYLRGNPWMFFWPMILIAAGLGMLARGFDRGSITVWPPPPGGPIAGQSTGVSSANLLSEWAFFGGVRRRLDTQDFQGGECLAIFGGINIDLTKAGMQKEEVLLEANAMFGGIDLRVPDNWQVVVRGAGIFGGYEDKTWRTGSTVDEKKPRLIVNGFAVFGGVVVKT